MMKAARQRTVRSALIGFALLCGGLASVGPSPVFAQAAGGHCERDLFQNEAGMRRQQTRMQAAAGADQASQCRTWREHVGFLQNSRAVFARCLTGRQRQDNVALMDQELADFRVLLAQRCWRP
jgi:hypothetical protein